MTDSYNYRILIGNRVLRKALCQGTPEPSMLPTLRDGKTQCGPPRHRPPAFPPKENIMAQDYRVTLKDWIRQATGAQDSD
ncbi:hypothetical protein, partial [Achromobacter dolens]|uniref:hypothetical protein n=1 Tax=Achromobacter dolens TaxID=1287738 RepID=UPI0031DC1609